MRYRFGDFELDLEAYTLLRRGQPLSLQPRVFDVLCYLVTHRERVVSKEELLDTLWGGEHVNESAVPWSVSHARRALGQARTDKQPIETVHGRGYRFTAELSVVPRSSPPAPKPPAARPMTAPRRSPFVGRESTMAALGARLAEAREGRGRLCVLVGEAGIGKTRCAFELAGVAASEGVRVWSGRCREGVGAPVFWPWIQILREALRNPATPSPEGRALLSRLMSYEDTDLAEPEVGASGRFWLLDGVTRLIEDNSRQAPLLLLIDDLQWADAGTLELLHFVAPELSHMRVLIVGTLRSEIDEAVQIRLRRLSRHTERITVSRLSADDIGRYLAEMAETQDVPGELAEAIHRASAGNPLFVQETVRMALTRRGPGQLTQFDPAAVTPPEVARDVLRTSLSRLGGTERSLLTTASVLGVSFDLTLLQRVSGFELDALLGSLEAAVHEGFIEADAPHRYRFAHELVRSVLYETLPTRQRVHLHRQAGKLLAELTTDSKHSEIAHHFYRSLPAGEYELVTHYAVRAADAARRAFAFEDASTYYHWALEAQALSPTVTPRARAELLLAAGTAEREAGRDREAINTLSKVVDSSRQHGFADLLVAAARLMRPTHAMSGLPDPVVRDALEECLRAGDTGPDERVTALSLLACVPPYSHDMARSKELSAEALQLARERGHHGRLSDAMRARLYSLSGPDDVDEILALSEEILALESGRETWLSGEALSARYAALIYVGRMEQAERALAELERIAVLVRIPELDWYCARLDAQRAFSRGEFDAAERLYLQLIDRAKRIGLSYGDTFVGLLRFVLVLERTGARSLVGAPEQQRLEGQANRGRFSRSPAFRAFLARLFAEADQPEQAAGMLDALAGQDFEDIPRDIAYLNTLASLALCATQLGDLRRCQQLYALLLPYAHHNTPNTMLFYEGSVSRYLGRLAVISGEPAEVVAGHFEAALTQNERMGARPQVVHTLRDYANWLATQPQKGGRVAELRDRATLLAQAMGMA